ncbi:hypothetical protein ACI8AF_16885 [Blastococcus sp. SYSU D00669]
MASAAPGILTAQADPDVAKRAWPRWVALGLAMLAVAAVGLSWPAAGGRVLLGAVGLFLVARGVVVLRAGALDGPARRVGTAAAVLGVAAVAVAAVSATATGWVLLAAVPVVLVGGALGLVGRGGTARRGGWALLVWAVLVTGLLAVTGAAQGWARAAEVGTVVSAVAVAVLAVPVLVGAAGLRAAAARPAPRPAPAGAGCAGCACGAGGCGALG